MFRDDDCGTSMTVSNITSNIPLEEGRHILHLHTPGYNLISSSFSLGLLRDHHQFPLLLAGGCHHRPPPSAGSVVGLTAPGAATKLGRELSEWLDIWRGPSENTLTLRWLASWRLQRKRDTRTVVRLYQQEWTGFRQKLWCEYRGRQ